MVGNLHNAIKTGVNMLSMQQDAEYTVPRLALSALVMQGVGCSGETGQVLIKKAEALIINLLDCGNSPVFSDDGQHIVLAVAGVIKNRLELLKG